jgi:hypothetical protein
MVATSWFFRIRAATSSGNWNLLLRTKTDAVDAALIARFCKSQSPEPWIPPLPEIRVLQALIRHCDHLKKTRAQQSVYAQSSDAAIVTASTREVIATLDEQIAQIERKIRQHFDGHPDLKQRRDCTPRPSSPYCSALHCYDATCDRDYPFQVSQAPPTRARARVGALEKERLASESPGPFGA